MLTQQELTEEDLRTAMLVASINKAMLGDDAIWGELSFLAQSYHNTDRMREAAASHEQTEMRLTSHAPAHACLSQVIFSH